MVTQSSDRKDRLAAALRQNLKRRKARARALDAAAKELPEETGDEAAAAPDPRPDFAPKLR